MVRHDMAKMSETAAKVIVPVSFWQALGRLDLLCIFCLYLRASCVKKKDVFVWWGQILDTFFSSVQLDTMDCCLSQPSGELICSLHHG